MESLNGFSFLGVLRHKKRDRAGIRNQSVQQGSTFNAEFRQGIYHNFPFFFF